MNVEEETPKVPASRPARSTEDTVPVVPSSRPTKNVDANLPSIPSRRPMIKKVENDVPDQNEYINSDADQIIDSYNQEIESNGEDTEELDDSELHIGVTKVDKEDVLTDHEPETIQEEVDTIIKEDNLEENVAMVDEVDQLTGTLETSEVSGDEIPEPETVDEELHDGNSDEVVIDKESDVIEDAKTDAAEVNEIKASATCNEADVKSVEPVTTDNSTSMSAVTDADSIKSDSNIEVELKENVEGITETHIENSVNVETESLEAEDTENENKPPSTNDFDTQNTNETNSEANDVDLLNSSNAAKTPVVPARRPQKPIIPAATENVEQVKKGPPKVPKKPSSKIAAFQEMLQKQQSADLGLLNKPPPRVPMKRPSATNNEVDTDSVSDKSATEEAPLQKVNKVKSNFAQNLNGMLGMGLPGMAFGANPYAAMQEAKKAALSADSNGDDDAKEESEKIVEPTKTSDVRRSRARGPRGRKLPDEVKKTVEINDTTLGNKLSIVVKQLWHIEFNDAVSDYVKSLSDDTESKDDDVTHAFDGADAVEDVSTHKEYDQSSDIIETENKSVESEGHDIKSEVEESEPTEVVSEKDNSSVSDVIENPDNEELEKESEIQEEEQEKPEEVDEEDVEVDRNIELDVSITDDVPENKPTLSSSTVDDKESL